MHGSCVVAASILAVLAADPAWAAPVLAECRFEQVCSAHDACVPLDAESPQSRVTLFGPEPEKEGAAPCLQWGSEPLICAPRWGGTAGLSDRYFFEDGSVMDVGVLGFNAYLRSKRPPEAINLPPDATGSWTYRGPCAERTPGE